MGKRSPAAELEHFLNFVEACSLEYKNAYDKVNEEDRRVQDFLHQMEFAKDQAERNRVATKLQKSRRNRRQNKDLVKRDEKVVQFFLEEKNRGSTKPDAAAPGTTTERRRIPIRGTGIQAKSKGA